MAKVYNLYNGLVQLSFDEAKHSYVVDGEKIISVTGVQAPKPGLVYWAAKEAANYVRRTLAPGKGLDEIARQELCSGAEKAHRNIADKAASIGTLAHQACETFAKTGKAERPVNEQAGRAFDEFLKWFETHNVKVHASERKVFSRKHRYAGTLDLLCLVDDVPCTVDLKTSSGIYDDYAMQLAAYSKAVHEETAQDYSTGWIVRIPKDGQGFETRRFSSEELDKAFDAFLGLLQYHKWAKA
jgi:hypothetical protein